MLTLTTSTEIDDATLQKAIELRISECFGALNIANALGGHQSLEWQVVRAFTPRELFDEARARKLPLETFKGAVADNAIADHPLYKRYVAGSL